MKRILVVGRLIARKPVYVNPAVDFQHFDAHIRTDTPDGNVILDRIADILYPVDGHESDQWNGGDVCADLNALLLSYRPDAPLRQKGGD